MGSKPTKAPRGNRTGDNFCEFWPVVKLLLLLSRGQETIERGFVMNKNMFDVNLHGSHQILRQLVKDYCTLLIWEDKKCHHWEGTFASCTWSQKLILCTSD